MTERSVSRLNSEGFTLLELLISITMLALITGIMGWTLSMAHRTLDKGTQKINTLENAKASFSLMESQIMSLFPYQFGDEGEKKILFSGSKDKLSFTSDYSLWRGTRGNTAVTYDVQTNNQGKQFLKVTEQIIGLDPKNEIILFDDCTNINFEYYLKNELEEGHWIDEWPPDEKGLPDKIKINIAHGTKNFSFMVNPPVNHLIALPSGTMIKQ